jgi:hypothetical protein
MIEMIKQLSEKLEKVQQGQQNHKKAAERSKGQMKIMLHKLTLFQSNLLQKLRYW